MKLYDSDMAIPNPDRRLEFRTSDLLIVIFCVDKIRIASRPVFKICVFFKYTPLLPFKYSPLYVVLLISSDSNSVISVPFM